MNKVNHLASHIILNLKYTFYFIYISPITYMETKCVPPPLLYDNIFTKFTKY